MKHLRNFENHSSFEGTTLDGSWISYDNEHVHYSGNVEVPAGPEMVDLGLPSGLKWAKWNVGANSETDYGLYFKWGETEGKTSAEASYFQGSIVVADDFQDAATAIACRQRMSLMSLFVVPTVQLRPSMA